MSPSPSPASALVTLLLAAGLASCGGGGDPGAGEARPIAAGADALVGREAVPAVLRAENNSDALVRWRLAGVRDRIVVHVDGHVDWDWLPEETVRAVLGAADEEGLRALEAHPYDLDAPAHGRFGIWNYLYPAHRGGIVREVLWVVPDGTLSREGGFERLRRDIFARHLQGVSADEVVGLTFDGVVASGSLLGLPLRILELDHLPALDEPVLLDLDADYFGTADASDQSLTVRPARSPAGVMEAFARRGLRSDLATVCSSTVGGYLPTRSRGLADELELWLTDPDAARRREARVGDRLREARDALERGDAGRAASLLRALRAEGVDEPGVTFLLAEAVQAAGERDEAARLADEAASRDPAYADAGLFRADGLYLRGRYGEALEAYGRLRDATSWPGYVRRRMGNCLYRLGRREEAEAAFREVLERHPDHADTIADLAVCVLDSGRRQEGLQLLRRACAADPGNGEHARKLAVVCLEAGLAEEALAETQRATRIRPGDPLAHNARAGALAGAGRIAEARHHAVQAARLDPANPDGWAFVGLLALRMGEPRAAVAAFRQSLVLAPEHRLARRGLAAAEGALSGRAPVEIDPGFP